MPPRMYLTYLRRIKWWKFTRKVCNIINMKRFFFSSLAILGILVLVGYFSRVEAAYLKFDKTSVDASVGETFTADVIVDAGDDSIVSADIYVKYDADVLSVEKVDDGTFFDTLVKDSQTGQEYIAGMFDDVGKSKTGSGTVATITFKVLKDSATTISYLCDTTASKTSKIIKNDNDATNIIECDNNGTLAVNSSSSSNSGGDNSSNSGGLTSAQGSLPKTGFMDSMLNLSIIGAALVVFGGVVKVWMR